MKALHKRLLMNRFVHAPKLAKPCSHQAFKQHMLRRSIVSAIGCYGLLSRTCLDIHQAKNEVLGHQKSQSYRQIPWDPCSLMAVVFPGGLSFQMF